MDDWLLFLFRGLRAFVDDPLASELWVVVFRFVPFILALELPYYLFVFSGILRPSSGRGMRFLGVYPLSARSLSITCPRRERISGRPS